MAKYKRTSISLAGKTKEQFDYLQKTHADTVALTSERLSNYFMMKIAKGDYDDIEAPKHRKPQLIYVDQNLKNEAERKAKELGFKSIKEMLELIIKDEYVQQSRQATRDEAIERFLKLGSGSDESEDNGTEESE